MTGLKYCPVARCGPIVADDDRSADFLSGKLLLAMPGMADPGSSGR